MTAYDVFDDPYCYKSTSVLKNKAGLRSAADLEAFELEMTTLRSDEPLPLGQFDPAHYRKIHRHIFQDVYTWAGKYRTVRTAKGGNWFCYPENMKASMDALFKRLKEPSFHPGSSPQEFIASAATFLCELNAIHPFREGNGRTQLAFLHLLGLRADHPLRLDRIDRATFMPAIIESFSGSVGPLATELAKLLA